MPDRIRPLIFVLLIAFGVAACDSSSTPPATGSNGVAPRQEFEIEGKVVAVDKSARRVTLDHKAIPGYMDAMTMPFAIRDPDYFDILRPGDELRGVLVIEGGRSYIDSISVQRSEPMPAGAPGSTPDAGAPREPVIGEQVGFRLTDENGKPLLSDDLRGQVALVTFIYTRCPVPDQCPLMTNNFGEVARLLAEAGVGGDRAQLVEVSFDTEHDTPAVLRDYERRAIPDAASRERVRFATGEAEEVRRLANSLGMGYMRDGQAVFNHSLRTALVSPDGKLVKLYRGNDWKPADVVADIRAALAGAQPNG